jgi:tRNA dimethylallyltransferase
MSINSKLHEPLPPPLLVLVGQTASGKSDLAIQLARRLNGEIICADSWTVRREVNIGTAKPTPEQRKLVPHHLVDIVGPDDDFTAAVFKSLALAAIDDIRRRGKLPVVVGGTGLYIDGLLYDYSFLPAGDRSLRIALNELSVYELRQRVEKAAISTGGIDTQNKRRLIRLLETNGSRPTRHQLRDNTLIIGLSLGSVELSARIIERTDAMLMNGLEAEVLTIAERYGWDCQALKGIGYREWHDYFLGVQTRTETHDKIIKSTRDLAKRQQTWFKRNKSIHWYTAPVNVDEIVDLVTTNLSK